MQRIEREEFLSLPMDELAKLVRESGTKTCVFPFDGTRRWFILEYGRDLEGEAAKNYSKLASQAYIDAYKIVFDHGIDNVVAPIFGGETIKRGEEYMREIGAGMSVLATDPTFIEFYKKYDIRVHFYGDYRKLLSETSYAYICDQFDEITLRTAGHKTRALFYGVCADEATESIAELSIKHYEEHGKTPSRRDLIEAYYGEYIERADIFIGFEKFTVFDYPMLGWGMESLYYMVAPALYVNPHVMREILYDHIYLRPVPDADFFSMPEEEYETVKKYYYTNREIALGVGELRGGVWYEKSNLRNDNND